MTVLYVPINKAAACNPDKPISGQRAARGSLPDHKVVAVIDGIYSAGNEGQRPGDAP